MAYTLHIAEAAEGDIREAFLWYEEQKEGLGNTFEKHISKALDSIRENPLKKSDSLRVSSGVIPKKVSPWNPLLCF